MAGKNLDRGLDDIIADSVCCRALGFGWARVLACFTIANRHSQRSNGSRNRPPRRQERQEQPRDGVRKVRQHREEAQSIAAVTSLLADRRPHRLIYPPCELALLDLLNLLCGPANRLSGLLGGWRRAVRFQTSS